GNNWKNPPLAHTINNKTFSAEKWAMITLYNGGGGITESVTNNGKTKFVSPWIFNPAGSGNWELKPNQNNYAVEVALKIGLPIQEK
ncbi:MAG: hypothetical protein FWG05_00245, partial [Kiritimatiellaeota bacterium]|nr:hypothetical protein [Kiritimatiellota bacterium]